MKLTKKIICTIMLTATLTISNFSVLAAEPNCRIVDSVTIAGTENIIQNEEFPAVPEMGAVLFDENKATLSDEIDAIAETIDVGEKDESYKGDINLYTTYGTLPTLYALLNVYKDIDESAAENLDPAKSYMWFLRGKTANPEKLPDNVELMAELSASQIYNADYAKRFMAYARKLYATYPNAHFNLYCDDLRAQSEITFFTFNSIPEDQYNVHLLSDGTGSYSFIKNYFYKDSEKEGVEAVEGAKDSWNLYEYWYNEYKKRAANGEIDTARFLDNNMGACYIMYAASSMDNIDYLLQWPELMVSDDPSVNEYLDTKMHRTKIFPSDIYKTLSEKSQNAFLDAILSASGLTKDEYDNTYLPGIKGGKKYMIISGTSPSGEGSSDSFEARVNTVINYFGDEYTYLYKPHPSWPASIVKGREDFLKSKNIVELPAQTPMEVILTAYPEVDLGGYNSSLYMSATGSHVKFFFAKSFNELSAPLPDLYNAGMYPDAILINMPELSFKDNKLTVNNTETLSENTVLAALTTKDGVVTGVKLFDVTAEQPVINVDGKLDDYDTVKFMLWDNLQNMKPLAKALEYKIQ